MLYKDNELQGDKVSIAKKIVKYIYKNISFDIKLNKVLCPDHELRKIMDGHHELISDTQRKIMSYLKQAEEANLSEKEVKEFERLAKSGQHKLSDVGYNNYDES